MGVRSLGNALASFGYKFGKTGTEASGAAGDGSGISATGGNQTSSSGFTAPNGFKYHVFTSSGSLVVASGSGEAYYLVVAGGGSGGYGNGAVSYTHLTLPTKRIV